MFFCNLWNDYTTKRFKIENKLTKFYKIGSEEMEDCFNIVKLLKDIKFLKVFNIVRHDGIDLYTKFLIHHNKKNIINVDTDQSDCEN